MLTTLEKAVAWAQTKSMWPDTFGLACCAIEMMSIVSSRYDIARFGMEAFRSSPRQADLLIVSGRVVAQDGRAAAADLRPDARAEVGDRDGRVRELGRDVQQLRVLQGVDKIVPVDIHVPGCPPRPEALMEGIVRLHEKIQAGVPPAYEIRGVADVSAPDDGVPGLVEAREAHGETTLVVEPARLVEACTHLRDDEGFNFLADVTAADYLGWGEKRRRRLHRHARRAATSTRPARRGSQRLPEPKPKRFAVDLPPARAARRRAARCACRSGSTTARRSRASSPSGRRPTGTSARPRT